MCNRYQPAIREKIIVRHLVPNFTGEYGASLGPRMPGPIVVRDRAVVAQWGMIPPGSKTRFPTNQDNEPINTNCARRERIASAPTFRHAWTSGQRCIVPAESYDYPNWTTGKNVWWRFWRADGEPWALAGIWSEWTDPETGEVVPSYSIVTQNCDGHPIMGLMHKPDPAQPADQQDKRSVVPLKSENWDQWLNGTVAQAEALIQLPEMGLFRHGPVEPVKQMNLPL